MRRLKLFIIAIMTCISVIMIKPDNSVNATSKMTLAQLQAKFPHGKYWNHIGSSKNNPDGWTNTPCKHHGYQGSGCSYTGSCGCNNVGGAHGAIQCMGYAYKLGLDAFGSHPYYWKTYAGNSAKDYLYHDLKAGDIIRYQNNHHSIFVTGVSGNTVTYTHCNVGATCVIQWGRTISKKKLAATLTSIRKAPSTFSKYGITISYDLDGGKGSISNHNIAFENDITVSSSNSISKKGYYLDGFYLYRKEDKTYDCGDDGWHTEKEIERNRYTKKIYYSQDKCLVDQSWTESPSKQSEFSFVAHWLGNSYTISFDANGGKGNMNEIDMIYGEEKILNGNTYLKSGYSFVGWNVYSQSQDKWLYTSQKNNKWYKEGTEPKSYEKTVLKDKSTVSKISSISDDIVILSAVWEPITYTITYDSNGGIGEMKDTLGYYGIQPEISQNSYTKEGYTFIGWNVYSKELCRYLYNVNNKPIWLKDNQNDPLILYNNHFNFSYLTSIPDDVIIMKAVWVRNEEFNYDFLADILGSAIGIDNVFIKETKKDFTKILNIIFK